MSDYVVFKEGGESFGSYRFIAYAKTKSQGVVVYLDQSSSNVVKVSVPIKAVDFFIKKLKERKWYDGEVVFDVFTVWSVTTCGYIKVRENSKEKTLYYINYPDQIDIHELENMLFLYAKNNFSSSLSLIGGAVKYSVDVDKSLYPTMGRRWASAIRRDYFFEIKSW